MSEHEAILMRTDHERLDVLYCFDCMHAVAYSPREDVLQFIRDLHRRTGEQSSELPQPDQS